MPAANSAGTQCANDPHRHPTQDAGCSLQGTLTTKRCACFVGCMKQRYNTNKT